MGTRKLVAWIGAAALMLVGIGGTTVGAAAATSSCVVNSNGDEHNLGAPSNPITDCLSTAGTVTLRSAIERFNISKGMMDVTFSASLPNPTTITLANGLLDITDATQADKLTITGNGIDNTIVDAHHASGLFHSAGAALSFNAMSLKNGGLTAGGVPGIAGGSSGSCMSATADISLSSVRLTGNTATGGKVPAGAIFGKKLTIHDSMITDNAAVAAVDMDYDGLLFYCSGLDMANSSVSNNSGTTPAGTGVNNGLFDGGGMSTVVNSLINGNTLRGGRGVDGIFDSNSVNLTDSTISGNILTSVSGYSDGIFDSGPEVHLVRSSVDDNTISVASNSNQGDCGIFCVNAVTLDSSSITGNTRSYGSGVSACSLIFCAGNSVVTVTNSTLAGNVLTAGANSVVHGQYVDANLKNAPVEITNSTVARNELHLGTGSTYAEGPFQGSSLAIRNSIFAENTAEIQPAASKPANCGSDITTATVVITHSLDTDGTCKFPTTNGNISNQAASFTGPAQVNAPGKTRTIAISATSPAKDTADNTLCPAVDQRGVSRLGDDPVCDMGAYEYVRPPVVAAVAPASTPPAPLLPKAGYAPGHRVPNPWWQLLAVALAPGAFILARRVRARL